MQDLEEAIRERAYHLWIVGGRQDGNAEAHWLTAQRDMLESSLASAAVSAPKKKVARKTKDISATSRKKTLAA